MGIKGLTAWVNEHTGSVSNLCVLKSPKLLLDGLGELLVVLGPRGVRRERRAPPLVVLRRVDPRLRRRAPLRAAPRAPQDAHLSLIHI